MTATVGATVLLGTPVDDVTMGEAVDCIAEMVRVGRATGRVHQVATVNVDFLVNARADPAVLDIMQRTDLAIPDGMGVVWGARLTGTPLRERTSGVDLVPALVERAAAAGWTVCLFGAAAGVAEEAAALLGDRFPGAKVVGLPAPRVAADGSMDAAALDPIRAIDPDVVAVALGNPKQERWIDCHGAALGAPVCIGIGGSLDFLTGVTRRAPAWMQRWGLEWIHRALSEPRRLAGRYAKDLVVCGPGIVHQAWRGRRRGSLIDPSVERADEVRRIQLRGPTAWSGLRDASAEAEAIRLDVAPLGRLDNVTLSAIASLRRRARRLDTDVEVVGVGSALAADAERLGGRSLLLSSS